LNLSSVIVALLKNPNIESLTLCNALLGPESSNVAAIKTALEKNTTMEILRIYVTVGDQDPNDFKLLFQGIAAAPKLHTLSLFIKDKNMSAELSELFANALIQYENKTL
jgi:hypothetical protein